MRYLLDTHSFIWFITGDGQLSPHAKRLISDDSKVIFISIASLWEMAIKSSIGKLHLEKSFGEIFPAQLRSNNIELLNISIEHLNAVHLLPFHHRDPFDRLIIAQAQVEIMPIIGCDIRFDDYEIAREW